MNNCEYSYLVKKVVKIILKDNNDQGVYDYKNITIIDHGDYQGTILFLIHKDTYQPYDHDYLITSVCYGSCSACDTLLGIQDYETGLPTETQLNDYMKLCLDICENIRKPYKSGFDDDYDVEMEYR